MVTIATVAISTTTRAVTTIAVTITLTLLTLVRFVEFLTTSVGSLEGGIMTADDKVGEPGDEASIMTELEI